MKYQGIFPKKLTIFGLIGLTIVFVLLLFVNSKNTSFVRSFYTTDVPGLQLYCGASRLISVNEVLRQTSLPDVNVMKLNQQGILYSLDELIKLESSFQGSTEHFSKKPSVENFRAKADMGVLPSKELEALKFDMQDFIENYLNQKNQQFEKQVQLSYYIATAGIAGLFLFFGLIGYVYYLYKKNLEALELTQSHLEEQRMVSMQSAKLASLGEMAAGMAHEINNPLAIISNTSQFMRKKFQQGKLTPEAMNEGFDDIDITVNRISKIIVGLRNISRDSNEEVKEVTLLKDIFNDVLGVCIERFKSHNVDLQIEDKDNLMESSFDCKRVQISQVLLNLLVNAFDAIDSKDERWIRIILNKDHNILSLKIMDSGKGISKELSDKMFQPFFTTKDIGKGTGLGLSLSKNIIEKHQGSLYLDSKEKNTCLVIELPVT